MIIAVVLLSAVGGSNENLLISRTSFSRHGKFAVKTTTNDVRLDYVVVAAEICFRTCMIIIRTRFSPLGTTMAKTRFVFTRRRLPEIASPIVSGLIRCSVVDFRVFKGARSNDKTTPEQEKFPDRAPFLRLLPA